jgi:hypothetical protein
MQSPGASGAGSSNFSSGGNPVVQRREEILAAVGGKRCVQVCWAITKPGTIWQYQQ